MIKRFYSVLLVLCGFLPVTYIAADESIVPEPFQGFDPASTYSIDYSDLTALLKGSVLDVGRSTREIAKAPPPKTGTRMTSTVKKTTINEGNRFHFELFEDDDKLRQMLGNIQQSIEGVPGEAPLEYFSRDEQLAYWLNLYNTTLLNEIVKVYPQRQLKKLLVGKKSILTRKLITVAGVPLSLNDIQFTILKENYGSNPLILYGLYQGIIGGPNIRKTAYTGENVYRSLRNNALEFINSNRGTYPRNSKDFRASSFYERSETYFANFEPDLKKHLAGFLEEPELSKLQSSTRIKPNIDDWTVTDVYGTHRQIGGSLADNSAALIGAVTSTSLVDGSAITIISTVHSSQVVGQSTQYSRFSPELVMQMKELDLKRQDTASKNARVTVEELGTAADNQQNDDNKIDDQNNQGNDQ